jgi:hypothetical protein
MDFIDTEQWQAHIVYLHCNYVHRATSCNSRVIRKEEDIQDLSYDGEKILTPSYILSTTHK